MNRQEKEILAGLLECWEKIPFPKETNTSPIDGYQSYTADMRQFLKAARELVMGLLIPQDVGDYYAPPELVLKAIQEWVARRAAAEWLFSYDEIKWSGK